MRLDKKLKKKLLLNAPYVLFVYLFDKAAQGIRLAPGADASQKLLHLADGFGSAFASPLPSFHPIDLLIGIAGAVIMWVVVYVRGKNAKKFRKNTEYGSARWGTPEDIEPYMDPDFRNNIILTQTERLTMNSRPKDPKTARNKNVLVIGGSGSGKTRFFVKPQLMQLHSSYPRLADGNRKKFNVYAKTREECEEALAKMIAEKKAEIAAEKAKMKTA